jgi:4-diphosphocytidyl-2C-methyl-D-erythritol kinase
MGITLITMPFDVLAPAKVNLFLNVTGRRDDGYHLLESLFVFTELADRIDGWHSELPHFHVSGEFAGGVTADQHNLVMKACEIMRRESGITRVLSFCLEKYIPVAAGLGGGSADAAAMLKALNEYHHRARNRRRIVVGPRLAGILAASRQSARANGNSRCLPGLCAIQSRDRTARSAAFSAGVGYC